MGSINILQIMLLSLYAFIAINDAIHMDFGLNRPLIAGCFAGIVMKDLRFGLTVGATLQLMVLGVSNFGGSSLPDFMSAALIGTALGTISGKGAEFGIGLAVPVGMLLVQLDVFARFANTFFQHRADRSIASVDLKQIERMNVFGIICWGFSRAIPVFLCLSLGSQLVESFVSYFPQWLGTGLKVAGGLLPVVGIAILLKYLPTKKYIAYLLIGFVLSAYGKIPMLGVAFIGVAMALLAYRKSGERELSTIGNGADEDE